MLSGGDLTTDLNIYDPTSKLIYTRIQTPFTWYDNSEITISGKLNCEFYAKNFKLISNLFR